MEVTMTQSFVLRADERGFNKIASTGATAAYVGGHPDAFVTRWSSFNFHDYQEGRPGFGRIRVFGDETFVSPGCSYSMHRHHNFIISAFVLEGKLTHLNTLGNNDELLPGDFYAFSAGSGGYHEELNMQAEPMKALYLWLIPDRLLVPPTYARGHFDAAAGMNRITTLIGGDDGALPIPQDAKVSRLVSDAPSTHRYKPRSRSHGVYAFVIEGEASCDGTMLQRRDSKAVWETDEFILETRGSADVLFVETIL
jgi:redox-sensitive bicupin YhaK (pirin superfamily)